MADSMESVMLGTVLLQRSLVFLLIVTVSFHGVAGLRCYTCENAQNNNDCNKDGPTACEPTMDACQTIVSYSDVSEKLSINKICTMNTSCSLQVNETQSTCDSGMTTSTGTSVCTTCCSDDACNVSSALRTVPQLPLTLASLLASFVIGVVLRAARSLDDVAAPE